VTIVSRVLFTSCTVCMMSVGCASPSFYGKRSVTENVATRTGHELACAKRADQIEIPGSVVWEDGLSEEEAVAVGLWNNPDYQELLADLEITRADVIQAAQLENPQITTMFPLSVKQWEFALNVPLDVLWLRPIRVAAAQLESGRVAKRLAQDGLNVVRDIRVAYIDWQLALQHAELAAQGLALRKDIARVAESRLAAGAVAELDVSAIRLEALFGEGEAAKAARDADLARERLRYLLGIQLTDITIRPGPMRGLFEYNLDVDEMVDEAIASRPDLRAVQLACCAAEQRADLARHDIWKLAGILPDINGSGKKGFEAGPGLQFAVPIFHQNQGAIARARADVVRLSRQYVKSCDLAALEVKQAHTQLLQARQDHEIWRQRVVPQAEAAVRSAREALKEDGVSLLLVLETTRQLLTARGRELDSAAQCHRALAELERSIGRRLSTPGDLPATEINVQMTSTDQQGKHSS
jgi:cobalt-zinc-cadmium efflux system outer membrane protein